MYFRPKMAWPPATYDIISHNHNIWPSLNLCQNGHEGWTNRYWKRQVLMFYPLGKKLWKTLEGHPPRPSQYRQPRLPPPPPAVYVWGLRLQYCTKTKRLKIFFKTSILLKPELYSERRRCRPDSLNITWIRQETAIWTYMYVWEVFLLRQDLWQAHLRTYFSLHR